MNAADEAVLRHERFIGGRAIVCVDPDGRRRIGLFEQALAQARALVSRGVGRRPLADEAEAPVDRNVVLIAESRYGDVDRRLRSIQTLLRLAELHGPARVEILLPQPGGLLLPALGNSAFLDRLLLVFGVALFRRRDEGGVDDLPRHGDVARGPQRRVEARKQRESFAKGVIP
jgi:hypothetical protein